VNLLRDIASERAMIFGGATPRRGGDLGWSRPDPRSNKQRFELIDDQTNNKQTSNKDCRACAN
jgi:hypothetical protein